MSDTGGSTMSYGDCLAKHCPECSKEIGLMFEAVGSDCEACKRRKNQILNECSGAKGYGSDGYKTEWYVIERLWYNAKKQRWESNENYFVVNRKETSKYRSKQGYKFIYGPAFRDQCMRRYEDLTKTEY